MFAEHPNVASSCRLLCPSGVSLLSLGCSSFCVLKTWVLSLSNANSLLVQVMVTNVTSLLKTVKAVEDEHTRGTRALESTIEAIGQEIRVS